MKSTVCEANFPTYCVIDMYFHSCSAVMGKAEGSVAREEWHGHVTALSVAPEFRRLGLAAKLMEMLEEISERWVSLLWRFSLLMVVYVNTKRTIRKNPASCVEKSLLIKFAVCPSS